MIPYIQLTLVLEVGQNEIFDLLSAADSDFVLNHSDKGWFLCVLRIVLIESVLNQELRVLEWLDGDCSLVILGPKDIFTCLDFFFNILNHITPNIQLLFDILFRNAALEFLLYFLKGILVLKVLHAESGFLVCASNGGDHLLL